MNRALLIILAILLFFAFAPISVVFALVKILITSEEKAKDVDILGNRIGYLFFNAVLIKDDNIYPFGARNETISKVLGMNKLANNLTLGGKLLDYILESIDENHTIKATMK